MSYGASAKAAGSGWAEPRPGDAQSTMAVLRVVGGDPASIDAPLDRADLVRRSPGGGSSKHPIQYAQAATGTLGGFGPSSSRTLSDAAPALGRAPAGALRIGGALVTASMLLQALQKLAERQQVEAAMARFHLSDQSVADLLARTRLRLGAQHSAGAVLEGAVLGAGERARGPRDHALRAGSAWYARPRHDRRRGCADRHPNRR